MTSTWTGEPLLMMKCASGAVKARRGWVFLSVTVVVVVDGEGARESKIGRKALRKRRPGEEWARMVVMGPVWIVAVVDIEAICGVVVMK